MVNKFDSADIEHGSWGVSSKLTKYKPKMKTKKGFIDWVEHIKEKIITILFKR